MPANDRRSSLVDSATGIFFEQGYKAATTRMLADASGVTEPILYRHFADKADLFLAVFEQAARALDIPGDEERRKSMTLFAGLCIASQEGPATGTFTSGIDDTIASAIEILHRLEPGNTGAAGLETLIGRLVLQRTRALED
jgi:AcrR family transcriptional regulator